MSSTNVERYTLDTNILIYALDRSAGVRHRLAAAIVDRSIEHACVLTLQALAEFVFAVTRKGLVPVPEAVDQARNWLAVFPVVSADIQALDAAYAIVMTGRLSLFDALLVTTAREAGCTILLSEDMQDGAAFDGLVVRNPFRADGLPEGLRSLLDRGEGQGSGGMG
jgi:predicted nucleic acid-binding protein